MHKPPRILIVDDNETNRDILRSRLGPRTRLSSKASIVRSWRPTCGPSSFRSGLRRPPSLAINARASRGGVSESPWSPRLFFQCGAAPTCQVALLRNSCSPRRELSSPTACAERTRFAHWSRAPIGALATSPPDTARSGKRAAHPPRIADIHEIGPASAIGLISVKGPHRVH
jgi:hypothetical protein